MNKAKKEVLIPITISDSLGNFDFTVKAFRFTGADLMNSMSDTPPRFAFL